MKQKLSYWILPMVGVVFCLWYVREATCDVIYSDYVRLVNSYLPDVWNPDKFFVADILTRIPANYIGRIINISFFGFSITFDRVLGVLGLGLSALVLGCYSSKKNLGFVWFALLMVLMFSLNKWEMLTNGSGWTHFMAFACFYYHYLVLDRVWTGEEKPHDRLKLILLPFLITLGIAGPYCAIYLVTVCLAYAFCLISHYLSTRRIDWRYLIYAGCAVLSVLLYLWSNSYAEEDHAGAVHEPLLTALMDKPSFFGRFFIKSFAPMVLGGETALNLMNNQQAIPSDSALLILGLLVIAAYLLALWLNFHCRLYQTTILPLMLLAAGGLNHVLIMLSRWIFINENYAMSSRYALQFQVGILGIILTFGLAWKQMKKMQTQAAQALAVCLAAMFLAGNLYTSWDEIKKAPYREESFLRIAEAAVNFESRSDKELQELFEYRPKEEGSGGRIRTALEILKENHWNVFSDAE